MIESPPAVATAGRVTDPRAPARRAPAPVTITRASRRAARAASRGHRGGAFRWAYVGNDLGTALALESILASGGRRLDMAGAIRRATEDLRDPYIAYVGALGASHPSTEWWLSPVSEKNQYVSSTFRHLCYVAACRGLVADPSDKPLLLFVESPAVRRCLRRALDDTRSPLAGRTAVRSRDWARALARRGRFLAREGWRLLACRWVLGRKGGGLGGLTPSPAGGVTAIITWVDGRCFGPDGAFADAYFADLSRRGRDRGVAAATVPLIVPGSPYRAALSRLRQAREPFLIPHGYLRAKDLVAAVWRSTFPLPRRRRLPLLQGLDVTDLVEEDEREGWVRTRGADLHLVSAMVVGWRRAGVPLARVVYPFENHIWERALIRAVREHFPAARLVGYQHARLSRFLLNYFVGAHEASALPLPDRIVTNGAHSAGLLRASAYGPARIVAGGALRHQYLFGRRGRPARRAPAGARPTVLVTPSIGLAEGSEALWKALRAFGGAPRYRVLLKCHPWMPFPRIAAALGVGALPAHFEATTRSVPALLEDCDVLVYTSATTCLEAIACGVPCVHLLPEADVDMDPLEDFPNLRERAATPDELARIVEDLLAHRETYVAARRAAWEEALQSLFGEVTEDFLRALLLDPAGPAAPTAGGAAERPPGDDGRPGKRLGDDGRRERDFA